MNNVKVEARDAAHRYRLALKQYGTNRVRVVVRGSKIIVGLTNYSPSQLDKLSAMLEQQKHDEELARTFGGQP